MLSVINTKCRKIGLYAECRYAECLYAKCRGATLTTRAVDASIAALDFKSCLMQSCGTNWQLKVLALTVKPWNWLIYHIC